jgi:hypothetical protein
MERLKSVACEMHAIFFRVLVVSTDLKSERNAIFFFVSINYALEDWGNIVLIVKYYCQIGVLVWQQGDKFSTKGFQSACQNNIFRRMSNYKVQKHA